jgi:L-seryl-tRNA(Ser) seleniumtransferase
LNPQDLLRRLPSVDALLGDARLIEASRVHGRPLVVAALRRRLDEARARLRAAGASASFELEPWVEELPARVRDDLDREAAGGLVGVVNATGVIVHTNLGRAPLGEAAVRRLAERAGGHVNLEMDLATGRRGRRGEAAEDLLRRLAGAEAACVVNNNAAALVLALNTFAVGKEAVVSRGELVEIGGSFRVPDICERAGARLVEVGTTNRTRLEDYRRACDSGAVGILLKVHPSNFRVVGFTEETSLAELVTLGRERGLPTVMDQGSGVLSDLKPWGVEAETPVPELVAAGADLVLFSGDKLLGGPQAGCMVGRRDAVEACRRNPLYRALRPGRLVLLALEATLWEHATGRSSGVPVLAQLQASVEAVEHRAREMVDRLRPALAGVGGVELSMERGYSTSGGGSSPTSAIPTCLVRVGGSAVGAEALSGALRSGRPPVVARVEGGSVLVDLRTVDPGLDLVLAQALASAIHETVRGPSAPR